MPNPDRDWQRIANEANDEISLAPQGRKEALLGEIAERLDIGVQTLRTYLLADRFVRSLPQPSRSEAGKLPAIALETAARWSRHDPAGAARAISEYAAGKSSIRSLARAEVAARRAGGVLSSAQQRQNYKAVLSRKLHQLELVWPADPKDRLQDCVQTDDEDPSGQADFMAEVVFDDLTRIRRTGRFIAVVVVGPYSVHRAYDGKAVDWCLRTLGLTFFHDQIALILPQGAPFEAFVEFLARTPSADKHIQLLQELSEEASSSRSRERMSKAASKR